MRAIRLCFQWRAPAVVAAIAVLVFGRAERAAAQDFTDYRTCLQVGAPWVLCTPLYNMPIATPEISLSASSAAPGWILYNGTTQALTIDGSGALTTYFNSLGNVGIVNGGALAIRVKFGHDGKFAGGSGGACGIGSTDDFCITGTVVDPETGTMYGQSGSILRGKVVHGGFKKNAITHGAPFDDYEFHVLLTGGDLYENKILPMYGSNEFAVEVFGYNDGVSYTGDHPFTTTSGFGQSYVMAFQGPTDTHGLVFDDPCDGQLGGFVTDFLNPYSGVTGAEIQLSGAPNLIPGTNGAYTSGPNLCVGTFQVKVLPPVGWQVYGADTALVTISTLANGHNSVISGVNFKLYSSPINTSNFFTFTQASWGTKPRGSNAGMLLKVFFDLVYPEEVEIGIPDTLKRYSITLTGAPAVATFLPQNNRPVPLDRSYVDPGSMWKWRHRGKFAHHLRISELAGEVLALELNVRFSAYNITKGGFGALKVQYGPLMGKRVDEVLALGNRVLGGDPLPSIFRRYDDLEDIIERINKNFEAGSPSKGYVK